MGIIERIKPEWVPEPSSIPFTALVHLLLGEMIPIWLTGIAAYTAAKKMCVYDILDATSVGQNEKAIMVALMANNSTDMKTYTLQHHVRCVEKSVAKFVLQPHAVRETVGKCPSCDVGLLDCTQVPSQTVMIWSLYLSIALTSIMVIGMLVNFVRWGLLKESFGRGRYLLYCWEIVQSKFYRGMLYVILAAAVAFWGHIVFYIGLDWRRGDESTAQAAEFCTILGFTFLTQVACLVKLLKPPIHAHRWAGRDENTEFNDFLFRRTWHGFLHHNDFFSVRLVDACWCAKNGDWKQLKQMVQEGDVDHVLQVICDLQAKESAAKEQEAHESLTDKDNDEDDSEDWEENSS